MPARSQSLSLSVLLLLSVCAQAQAPPPARPAISFAPEAVTASGITPGGRVVWFGVAREISDQAATVVRRERIVIDPNGMEIAVRQLPEAAP